MLQQINQTVHYNFHVHFLAFSFASKLNLGFHGSLKRIPFWPPGGKQCPWNCTFKCKNNWLCQLHLQKLLTKIWSTFELLLFSKRDHYIVLSKRPLQHNDSSLAMLELLDAHYMSQYEAQCLQAPHPQCLIPPSITNLNWSNGSLSHFMWPGLPTGTTPTMPHPPN